MENIVRLTDLEKEFMEKALVAVKSQMAGDILDGKIKPENEYLDTLKSWMWEELHLNNRDVNFILAYPNKYMKFSGVNPNAIIRHASECLDSTLQKTEEELSEGKRPWVLTYNAIKDYLGKYPLETEFKFSLPNTVYVRMKSDNSYSEWIPVKVNRRNSSMSSLDGKVSDFLVDTLKETLKDKTAELTISNLEQTLNLKDREGEYKFHYTPGSNRINLVINKAPSIQFEYSEILSSDDLYGKFCAAISQFESRYNNLQSTTKFLDEYLTSKGFSLQYSTYNVFRIPQNQFKVDAFRDDYHIAFFADIRSLSSIRGQKKFKEPIEKGFEVNAKIRAYLTERLSSEDVEWKYIGGNEYSTLHLGSFTHSISVMNFCSVDSLSSFVDSMLVYAKVEKLARSFVRKYLIPLNVNWELKTDDKWNLLLYVSLPGIPKMVKNLSLRTLEKDVIAFSDQVIRKKKTLHIQ